MTFSNENSPRSASIQEQASGITLPEHSNLKSLLLPAHADSNVDSDSDDLMEDDREVAMMLGLADAAYDCPVRMHELASLPTL